MQSKDLDAFDLKILKLVQNNSKISQEDIGKYVNLSTAAVNRRLKKLHDIGAIESYITVINPNFLSYTITIITTVKVINEQLELLENLRHKFANCKQVQQSYYVTGEWDFVLIILVKSMEEYTKLADELFFKDKNISKFQSLIAMKKDKISLLTPIDI